MAAKLVDEDNVPFEEILKAVSENSEKVLRVLDAMNLGRSIVKPDGVYRIFADGTEKKVASGDFPDKKLKKLTFQL
ncbi:hypothetical protein A5893_01640 [Pedobacter psychrophilus]|uniref:Uncharacterized protein n=1 Tax=Pedobacter psychrophilus TaxID=1826909 RepID=A0A179DL61_9SPHI|nr:hypothetical protein [Pedobacter psychrophilus]OAQ41846.1 hypothetical protein A5893_01640 [Pedobacter psychrophilus]